MDSRAMLDEYFSFSISDEGLIESLPLLLPGYTPNINRLPLCQSFLLVRLLSTLTKYTVLVRIGIQVDWTDEKACFETFLRELAYFYIPTPLSSASATKESITAEKWKIQHSIFPALRSYLSPPESLLKSDVIQVTSLESLYRVYVTPIRVLEVELIDCEIVDSNVVDVSFYLIVLLHACHRNLLILIPLSLAR